MNTITSSQVLKCAVIVLVAILAIGTILCFYDLGYKNGLKDGTESGSQAELEITSFSDDRAVETNVYTLRIGDGIGLATGTPFVKENNVTQYDIRIHSNRKP